MPRADIRGNDLCEESRIINRRGDTVKGKMAEGSVQGPSVLQGCGWEICVYIERGNIVGVK